MLESVSLKSLKDAPIKLGTRVILRADFDVAMDGKRIVEDFRIREALPTINLILKRGGRIRIISHLKRPYGKRVGALSMRVVAQHLEKLLKRKVLFISDPLAFRNVNRLQEILFLENIRFFPGEETNDAGFAKKLARWGDIYINEAFANSHRKHASVVAITRFLPSFAGLRLSEEISNLQKILKKPKMPLVAILGGAKLETKLPLIKKFLAQGGEVLVGGALANTLLAARGLGLGSSPVDEKLKTELGSVATNSRLHLPLDLKVAKSEKGLYRIADIGKIKKGEINFDIGPETYKEFARILRGAKTIVWNGPLGVAESRKFSSGTVLIAKFIKEVDAFKVVGGGDTIALLKKYQLLRGFDHVSTGGGAMLEFLVGEKLPGIEALKQNTIHAARYTKIS